MDHNLSLPSGRIEFPGSRSLTYRRWVEITSHAAKAEEAHPEKAEKLAVNVDSSIVKVNTPADIPSGMPFALYKRA
jgi:hypothetical protein